MLLIDKVTKNFGDFSALNNISLTVQEGELVGLLGSNGAGKSTLFSLISGINTPTSGTVRIHGLNPRKPETRRLIGMTPQGTGLDLSAKVEKFLYFIALHYGTQDLVPEIMEDFHLAPLRTKIIGTLSGGQQRLVAVACAFIADAPLTLLDEPTTGLDTEIRSAIWEVIRNRRSRGALIITSHYIEEIEQLCERVVVLNKGSIIADAPTETLSHAQSSRIITLSNPAPELRHSLPEGLTILDSNEKELILNSINPTRDLDYLSSLGWPCDDLTVTAPSLEQAFITLTHSSVAR